MSHGNEKAVLGLMAIAFRNSKSLQKALADEGDDPETVSRFVVRHYRAIASELVEPERGKHED
jgi:hypothetical protein